MVAGKIATMQTWFPRSCIEVDCDILTSLIFKNSLQFWLKIPVTFRSSPQVWQPPAHAADPHQKYSLIKNELLHQGCVSRPFLIQFHLKRFFLSILCMECSDSVSIRKGYFLMTFFLECHFLVSFYLKRLLFNDFPSGKPFLIKFLFEKAAF